MSNNTTLPIKNSQIELRFSNSVAIARWPLPTDEGDALLVLIDNREDNRFTSVSEQLIANAAVEFAKSMGKKTNHIIVRETRNQSNRWAYVYRNDYSQDLAWNYMQKDTIKAFLGIEGDALAIPRDLFLPNADNLKNDSEKISADVVLSDATTQKPRDIIFRLQLAECASCTCLTKTPEPQYHAEDCRYRVLREAEDEINRLRAWVMDCRDRVLSKIAQEPTQVGRDAEALGGATTALLRPDNK